MREDNYPRPVTEILATLAGVFRHQNQPEIVELLESANAHFDMTDFDNWNGGTRTWALRLEVPVSVFASAEPRLQSIVETISAKLEHFNRPYPNDHIGEVTVFPVAAGGISTGERLVPLDSEVRRLWPDGRIRLFLSHVAKYKVAVSSLKDALAEYGVSAFVAHEDIEPSREWQDEIELALRSMDALVALVTPEFRASRWADQEVGWAFGRGVLVLPVRLGADPYGFAGKVQAVPGSLDAPIPLAALIMNALLNNTKTHARMRYALVSAFVASDCYATATRLKDIILTVNDFTPEEQDSLKGACTSNHEVAGARGVRQAIYDAFGEPESLAFQYDGADVPF